MQLYPQLGIRLTKICRQKKDKTNPNNEVEKDFFTLEEGCWERGGWRSQGAIYIQQKFSCSSQNQRSIDAR